ncbi:hypothetical protein M885DRAFT_625153 [Pelagophyceae sp. CCMP2097]|nr:hypothetical protein M885DRAFT_625153 [Pelagophyceae sp. CCMP2097]
MQSYKGAACWRKKCAGSTSGKDNYSRVGCSPASAEYPNCKLYKSLSRLSASTKRARTLEGPGDNDGGPTRQRARREDGSALPPEKVDAGATGSIELFAAHRRAFFAGHHDSELKSAQHQESEDACDAGTANLFARCHKLKAPIDLMRCIQAHRVLQVARDPPYDSKLYYEAAKPSTCESVTLGGKGVELAGKMTHQMCDRSGLVPCLLADGHVDWISGRMRTCRNCQKRCMKCTLCDYDGRMSAQMSESALLELPASPLMAYGRVHVGHGLQDSLVTDPINNQAGATLTNKVVEFGARSHDMIGAAYEQLLMMYVSDLERYVDDKTVLQSRRHDYERLDSQPFDQ